MNCLSKFHAPIYIMLLLGFVLSCSKKKYSVKDENAICACQSFIDLQDYYNLIALTDTSSVFNARYNPVNDNEIIYFKLNANMRELFRYNLATDQKVLIGSFPIINSIDWGINDWLLMEIEGNIWKMKSNGNNLTQLTSDNNHFHPKWNFNSSKIMAYYFSTPTDEHFEMLNPNGVFIDSIKDPAIYKKYPNASVKHSKEWFISFTAPNYLHVVDLNNRQILRDLAFESIKYISEVLWINDNEAILNSTYGLYHYTHSTNSLLKLRCQCPQKQYRYIVSNALCNKLLMTRVLFNQIESSAMFNVKYEIVELDLETMTETKIELD